MRNVGIILVDKYSIRTYMKKLLFPLLLLSIGVTSLFAQAQNVNLDHEVYGFLKEMKVKKIISPIHDDVPNMSYSEVKNLLNEIENKKEELSPTELELLAKYRNEFFFEDFDGENTSRLFNPGNSFWENLGEFTSGREKFLYYYMNDYVNFFVNGIAHFTHGQSFSSPANNAELYDIGIRAHGTLLDNIGFSFSIAKGGVNGSRGLASVVDPRLNFNFKFVENIENISNYDFAEGYIRYQIAPVDDMKLAVQLGREKIKFGYGYSNSLAISGEGPTMDFLRFDFRYGVLSFSSIHASTVGEFSHNMQNRFTKYIASNKIKITLPDLFEFGIGESIVYSGRGLEWAYVNPMLFYKYAEMSLQDRDNGTIFLDLQTDFIKDFEIQATFFLDEDILSNLQDLDLFSNKTAYQLGFFWYEPFSLYDLSLICEYTRIRPYVYTHTDYMNTFTSFGTVLGHRIGPNADEIMARINYNLSSRVKFNLEYRHSRSGENIYSPTGVLLKNAGGDPFQPYRFNVDATRLSFLDGIRYNQDYISAGVRLEPWREIFFDINYTYSQNKNIETGSKNVQSYLALKMTIEY